MANNTITETKNGKYLKKTDVNSYVHYQFDTNDSIVYLSEKIDGADGNGAAYAKDARLHDTLCALYTLASKGGQASTDLATLIRNFNDLKEKHTSDISAVNTSIATTKSDLLGTDSDTAGANTIHGANKAAKNAQATADQAMNIANGQSRAYVFANVAGLRSGTLSSNQPISGYKVGDSIYIIAPDVSDFWISGGSSNGAASNVNVINSAKKGDTVIVKWGSSYVSLTALESKRDLSGYATTSALNSALGNFYDKGTADDKYVPYNNAKYDVNLGNHTITVGDATVQANPINTKIAGGSITLNGLAKLGTTTTNVGRKVEINVTGITVDEEKTYKYPIGNSGTLATQEFVRSQIDTQADSLINQTRLTFSGDVSGTGVINDPDIQLYLNDQTNLPDKDDERTFSAVHVNKQGIVTSGAQQIVFALNLEDSHLNNLAIGGVAIIDAI